jgi:hypothetical protein
MNLGTQLSTTVTSRNTSGVSSGGPGLTTPLQSIALTSSESGQVFQHNTTLWNKPLGGFLEGASRLFKGQLRVHYVNKADLELRGSNNPSASASRSLGTASAATMAGSEKSFVLIPKDDFYPHWQFWLNVNYWSRIKESAKCLQKEKTSSLTNTAGLRRSLLHSAGGCGLCWLWKWSHVGIPTPTGDQPDFQATGATSKCMGPLCSCCVYLPLWTKAEFCSSEGKGVRHLP